MENLSFGSYILYCNTANTFNSFITFNFFNTFNTFNISILPIFDFHVGSSILLEFSYQKLKITATFILRQFLKLFLPTILNSSFWDTIPLALHWTRTGCSEVMCIKGHSAPQEENINNHFQLILLNTLYFAWIKLRNKVKYYKYLMVNEYTGCPIILGPLCFCYFLGF